MTFEDVCCVSDNHSLSKKTVSIDELSEYPMAMFSKSFHHYDSVMGLFEKIKNHVRDSKGILKLCLNEKNLSFTLKEKLGHQKF